MQMIIAFKLDGFENQCKNEFVYLKMVLGI